MLAPKLRFKEFNDEWNYKLFNEIFEFIQNNSFSRDMLNYSENSKIYNIHYGDILTKYGEIIDFNIISNIVPKINDDISLLKFEDKSYLKNGDIIIADTAEDLTVGKSCEVVNLHCKALSGLHTIPCRPKFKFASQYLGEYINSTSYHSQLIPYITGIKVSSISKTSIIKTKIYFPTVKEQEKISKLFSQLNKKIELQQRKIEVLKMYKRGLIYKLLKNITSYKKIGEIVDFQNGTGYEKLVDENGNYNLISLNSITLDGKLNENMKKIKSDISLTTLKANDIVMIMSDVGHGNFLGISAIIPYDNVYVLNQRVGLLRIQDETIPYYLLFAINNCQLYFKKHGQGSSQLNLSKDDILNCKIPSPSLDIQINYSKIFALIDKKIHIEELKMNKILKFKKSLLQQMFI